MNILKRLYRFSNSNDERIQMLGTKIYAEAGMFIATVAFIDVIIRGVILNYPSEQWISSMALVSLFAVYVLIREIATGILNPQVETKEQFKKQFRTEGISILGGLIYASYSILKEDHLPNDLLGWLKIIGVFLLVGGGIYVLLYSIMRISFKRSSQE